MEDLFTVEEVLIALEGADSLALEGGESDFEGEEVFCYGSGGITEVGFGDGGEDFHEEEDTILDEEESGHPVPTGSRDQDDGEY